MRPIFFSAFLLFCVIMTSCVSQRKYDRIKQSESSLQSDYSECNTTLEATTAAKLQLEEERALRVKELDQTKKELVEMQAAYDRLDKTNRDLMARYDRMLEMSKSEVTSATDEKAMLQRELNEKAIELNKREADLLALEMSVKAKEDNLARLQAQYDQQSGTVSSLEGDLAAREQSVKQLEMQVVAREARVKELEAAIAARDQKLNSLRERVKSAFVGMNADDLNVERRNGRVYISLSQELLFKTGSSYLDASGRNALVKLAEVLKRNPDMTITVEGHTDSDGDAEANWKLSTDRSLAIIKVLEGNGVDPKKLISSGRGEYYPIATNESAAGKALNRRTEIILTPNVDEVLDVIKE